MTIALSRARIVVLAFVALVAMATSALLAATPAQAHQGSDAPTPYMVSLEGITLPAGDTFQNNGHVNVRTLSGKHVNLHFEAKCVTRTDAECAGARHGAAQFIGTSFIPWTAFDIDISTECVTWIQIHGYNQHFGEGGQSPTGKRCSTPEVCEYDSSLTKDDANCVPPVTPEVPLTEVIVPNPPQFVDFCGTENDELQVPSDTDTHYYESVWDDNLVTVTAIAREGFSFLHGDRDNVTSLNWSFEFSDDPCVTEPNVDETPDSSTEDKDEVSVVMPADEGATPPARLAETGGELLPGGLAAAVLLLVGGAMLRLRSIRHNN